MATNYWQNGGVNTAWSSTSNWSLGHTPTSSEDVVVPAGTGWNCNQNSNPASCRSLDMSAYDQAFSGASAINVSGASGITCSVKLGWASSTWSGTLVTKNASATSTLDIYFNGKTLPNLTINSNYSAAITNIKDTAIISGNFQLTSGAFNDNGNSVTCGNFTVHATNTCSIAKTGEWTLSKNNANFDVSGTGLSWSDTGGSISYSDTSSTAKTFNGGGRSFNAFNYSVIGQLTIKGANTFTSHALSGNAKTILFPQGVTTSFTNAPSWTGALGQKFTIKSDSDGNTATFSCANNVTCNYLTLQDTLVTGGGVWNAGVNSDNVSNNTDWIWGGTTWTHTINDYINCSESYSKVMTFNKTFADSITSSDSYSKVVSFLRTFNDSTISSDNISAATNYNRTLVDSVTITDILLKQINKSISDAIIVTDNYSKVVSFIRAISDTITISDDISKSLNKLLQDVITSTDSYSKVSVFYRSFSDNVTVTDAYHTVISYLRTLADSVTITDNYIKTLGKYLSDDITLTENLAKEIRVTLQDIITSSDDRYITFEQVLSDILNLTDSQTMNILGGFIAYLGLQRILKIYLGNTQIYNIK